MSESGDRPYGPGQQDPTFGAFDATRDPWARPPDDANPDETVKLTKDQPAQARPYQPSSYDPPGAELPTYIPPDYMPPSYDQPTTQVPSYEPPSYAPPSYPPPSYPPPPPTVPPPYSDPNQGGYGQPYQQPGYPAADPYQQYGAPAYGQPPAPSPYGFGAQPGYPGGSYGYAPATSGKATAVMILGIASLVTVWCYGIGIIPAIVGLVMSGSAKRELENSGGRLTGLGMVTAGRVTGWISVGLSVIFIGLLIVAGVLSAISSPDYTGN